MDIAGVLRHSCGPPRILGVYYSCVGDAKWHGLFADRFAYEQWLGGQGKITRIEQLERIPRVTLLTMFSKRYG